MAARISLEQEGKSELAIAEAGIVWLVLGGIVSALLVPARMTAELTSALVASSTRCTIVFFHAWE